MASFAGGILSKGEINFNALFDLIAKLFDAIAAFFNGEYAVEG